MKINKLMEEKDSGRFKKRKANNSVDLKIAITNKCRK